jgi:hypothetical protein
LVSDSDVLQRPKETITVAGDTDVAGLAWRGGAGDPADAAVQDEVVGAREDRHLDFQARDPQQCEGCVHLDEKALLILLDATLVP